MKNEIKIVNLRFTRECIRVDRATCLGNPEPMKNESDAERNRVCDYYDGWLRAKNRDIHSPQSHTVALLARKLKEKGELVLGCWCAPKRCHAESIRALILEELAADEYYGSYEGNV